MAAWMAHDRHEHRSAQTGLCSTFLLHDPVIAPTPARSAAHLTEASWSPDMTSCSRSGRKVLTAALLCNQSRFSSEDSNHGTLSFARVRWNSFSMLLCRIDAEASDARAHVGWITPVSASQTYARYVSSAWVNPLCMRRRCWHRCIPPVCGRTWPVAPWTDPKLDTAHAQARV